MITATYSYLRTDPADVLQLAEDGEQVVIDRHGHKPLVILTLEEYQATADALHALREAARRVSSIAELAATSEGRSRDEAPADQLIRLIRNVLARGHVASAANPQLPPPGDARQFGWTQVGSQLKPMGPLLGWVRGQMLHGERLLHHPERLLLDTKVVFDLLQTATQEEGIPLAAKSVTAAGRILARAVPDMTYNEDRKTHRVRIAGQLHHVWNLPLELFFAPNPQ